MRAVFARPLAPTPKLMLRRSQICATPALDMPRGCSQSRGWLLPCAALVASCGPLIGLEPLKDLPDAGGPSSVTMPYDTTSKDAGPSTNGDAADAGSPRSAGSSGSTHASGSGGSKPSGGAGAGGKPASEAGRAASGGQGPSTNTSGAVRGTVIDTRQRPVANARVQIGDQMTSTDASGAFTMEAVPEAYDLGVVIDFMSSNQQPAHHAWFFEGLHRRDPTLEVYPTGRTDRIARLLVHGQGAPSPLPENHLFRVAIGGPNLEAGRSVYASEVDFSPGISWSGAATASGMLHALLVRTVDQNSGTALELLSYDAKPFALQADNTTDLNVDLTKPPVASTLRGSVTHHGGRPACLAVARWPDGASLYVDAKDTDADAFSLLVPLIPDASLAVIAREGEEFSWNEDTPYAVAFVDDAVPGQNLSLSIPSPPIQIVPAVNAVLAPDTEFEWRSDTAVSVLRISSADDDVHDSLFIVVAGQRAHLPTPKALPYSLPHNIDFTWHVERHSDAESLDAATAKSGLLSAYWDHGLHGEKRGSGSYAESSDWAFRTPP